MISDNPRYDASWINDLVFRDIKLSEVSDNILAKDIPIIAAGIDEENKEAYFLDVDSAAIMRE